MKNVLKKSLVTAIVASLSLAAGSFAGSLTPSGSVASTMHSLADIYDSIVGTFNSTSISANVNGSLMENLKYIEANLPHGVSSNSLDFDEFVNAMNLDANTSVASHGFTFSMMGNVGIGTTSPDQKLDVQGDIVASSSNAHLLTLGTSSSSGLFITSYRNNSLTHAEVDGFAGRGTAAVPLAVQANDWLLRLGATGHDGTGFSSGGYDAEMHIEAAQNFTTTAHGTQFTFLTTPNGTVNNGLERMRITDQGNVGIGTTTPDQKLDVAGNITASTSGNVDLILNNTAATYGKFTLRSAAAPAAGRLDILGGATGTTNLVSIASSGNVGVGTTSPIAKLDVRGALSLGDGNLSELKLNNAGSGNQLSVTASTSGFNTFTLQLGTSGQLTGILTNGGGFFMDHSLRFDTSGTANIYVNNSNAGLSLNGANTTAGHIFIESSGNVGIGDTTPDAVLDVNPPNDYTGPLLLVASGSNERFRITSSGNVGIGTTSPDAKLDVTGGIVASTSAATVSTLSSNGSGGFSATSYRAGTNTHGAFTVSAAAGTAASPVALSANTQMAIFGTFGYDGTSFTTNGGTNSYDAAIFMFADQAFTTSNHGTRLSFFITPTNTATNVEAMRLTAGGNLGVGITVPTTRFDVKGSAGNYDLFNVASSSGGSFLHVTKGGNVGIGTSTPNEKLDVAGPIELNIASSSGAADSFALCHNANGNTNNQEILDCGNTPSADYMEMYPMDSSVAAGDIVMPADDRFATTTDRHDRVPVLILATDPARTLGIVSVAADAGDFNSVGHNIAEGDNPQPLALNGRVKVKVNMEKGPIAVGDPVTLSSTPGVGTKATTAGYIVGTALESAIADSQIMVYVRPTYWAPELSLAHISSSSADTSTSWLQWDFQRLFAAILEGFANILHITFGDGSIATKKLCLEDVCVTRDQLQQLLQQGGQVHSSVNSGDSSSASSDAGGEQATNGDTVSSGSASVTDEGSHSSDSSGSAL